MKNTITFEEYLNANDITFEEYHTFEKEFKLKCLKCYNEYITGDRDKNCIDDIINQLK